MKSLIAVIVFAAIIPLACTAVIVGAIIIPTQAANACAQVAGLSGTWRPPLLSRYIITSPYGIRYHPVLHVWKLHSGIDLVSSSNKKIVAAADGIVKVRSYNAAYGNQVVIDHGGGIQTRYGHMAKFANIHVGQTIGAGTDLGIQGSTGYVTGPHLHFEVIKNGHTIDPKPFMATHGSPLNGTAHPETPGTTTVTTVAGPMVTLPAAGVPRKASLTNPALPIPANIKALYVAAASKYGIPWALLAGIGMEETGHGRNTNTSSAGAKGLMQFMPATWRTMGVDGDNDGRAVILNPADSIFSAANYLTRSGVKNGAAGVRKALYSYNHADWYVNDVLFYANSYAAAAGEEGCQSAEELSAASLESAVTTRQPQLALGVV